MHTGAASRTATGSRTGRSGEIVRQHFGLREGAPADEVAGKLDGREILGLAAGLDVAVGLHPLDAREGMHAGGRRLRATSSVPMRRRSW